MVGNEGERFHHLLPPIPDAVLASIFMISAHCSFDSLGDWSRLGLMAISKWAGSSGSTHCAFATYALKDPLHQRTTGNALEALILIYPGILLK